MVKFLLIYLISLKTILTLISNPRENYTKYINLYNKLSLNNTDHTPSEIEILSRNNSLFCLNDCSFNGYCMDNKCYCTPGFYGNDCSKTNKKCVNNCSDKGECVEGRCVCNKSYAGIDCSVSKFIFFIKKIVRMTVIITVCALKENAIVMWDLTE